MSIQAKLLTQKFINRSILTSFHPDDGALYCMNESITTYNKDIENAAVIELLHENLKYRQYVLGTKGYSDKQTIEIEI